MMEAMKKPKLLPSLNGRLYKLIKIYKYITLKAKYEVNRAIKH